VAGVIEISTLNTQVAVPGELRFVAYETPERLPQPWRDKTYGVQAAKPASVGAITQPQASPDLAPLAKTAKSPRIDPGKVSVTYKHKRPDSEKPKAKRAAAQEPLNRPASSAVSRSRTRSQLAQPPTAREQRRSADEAKPLTNMALAFQRLAQSDPEVEQVLIAGFRGPTSKAR
jgi:uncharacterized protein (UPF0261 family)